MTGKILLEKWYSRQIGCGFVQQRAAEVKVNPVLHRQAEQMSLLYGFWDTLGAGSLFFMSVYGIQHWIKAKVSTTVSLEYNLDTVFWISLSFQSFPF